MSVSYFNFDLHVLIEAKVDDPAQLLAALPDADTRLRQAKAELWLKIEAMTYAQFINDVAPFLPLEVAGAIDESTFDEMLLQVATNVEKWLQDAASRTAATDLE